jgi:hypothetical protein
MKRPSASSRPTTCGILTPSQSARLVRTMIVIREVLSCVLDDGDFDVFDPNDPHRTIGKLAVGANFDLRHPGFPPSHCRCRLKN